MTNARLRRSIAALLVAAVVATLPVVSAPPAAAAGAGTGTIAGVVTDQVTGLPIAGASVSLRGASGPDVSTRSGADGTFTYANIALGTYRYTAAAVNDNYPGRVVQVVLQRDRAVVSTKVELERRSTFIRARFTVQGVALFIEEFSVRSVDYPFGGGAGGYSFDATGTFNFYVTPGTYEITVVGSNSWYEAQTKQVTVTQDQVGIVDFELQPRTLGIVYGQWRDQANTIVPFICVALRNVETNKQVGNETTDQKTGAYNFRSIPAGTYTIRFRDCDTTRNPSFGISWLGGGGTLATATTFTVGYYDYLYLPDTVLVPRPAFGDVPADAAFVQEIEWMFRQGISTGYVEADNTRTFHPIDEVSREAMAAFLYRFAGSPAFSPPASPSFVDVPTSAAFYKEIEWMKAQGITTGTVGPGGTLRYLPSDSVSRQAMSAFLYRQAGSPAFAPPAIASFADVPTDSQFFAEIEWMKSVGITTGFADGYHPTDNVSRQAMAAFLSRFENM